MQYNAPNYKLIGSYIDSKVSTKQTPEEAQFDSAIAQSIHFDRNGLRGNRNQLYSQISEIMAQTDYNMGISEKYEPRGRSNRNPIEPQDLLNDKQNSILGSNTHMTNTENVNGGYVGSENDQSISTIPMDGMYSQSPYSTRTNKNSPNGNKNHRHFSDMHGINPYIKPPVHYRLCNNWSLIKTVILVIILLGLFYLVLNLIFQKRAQHTELLEESNMNPPNLENQ